MKDTPPFLIRGRKPWAVFSLSKRKCEKAHLRKASEETISARCSITIQTTYSAETLELVEDDIGLRVRITPPDTSWARDITTSIRRGDISQMSIGFVVEDDEWSSSDGIDTRELKKVRLFDVSPVTFPAYTATDVGVRAMQEYDVYKTEQRKMAEENETAVKKAKEQDKLKNLQTKFKII